LTGPDHHRVFIYTPDLAVSNQKGSPQQETAIFRDATSSQVKLLITNNAFFIVQRAKAQSKTGIVRGYGVAEAPPGFQAGWSDCMYFFLSFCPFSLLIWVFRVSFCTHEGTLPYRILAQMSCREEADDVSLVANVLIECAFLFSARRFPVKHDPTPSYFSQWAIDVVRWTRNANEGIISQFY
jgi:hypothetical protein